MAKKLIYGLDDNPPFTIMVLAGVQHVLTLFGATTLVPLIFGPAMGMDVLQVAAFISCVYFGMGAATLIQTHPKLGSGLPIVQGSSFSFIPSVMTNWLYCFLSGFDRRHNFGHIMTVSWPYLSISCHALK